MEQANKRTDTNVRIESSWRDALKDFFTTDEWHQLAVSVRQEYLSDKEVYPRATQVFHAFNCCPFTKVRVVILGQDPYHGKGQAHGLSFSVPQGTRTPPSLQNIFKEIQNDTGVTVDTRSGDLTPWTEQGVFLLNSILTVVANTPTAHRGLGWEGFTDTVIQTLSEKREHLVFLLWGAYAKGKQELIDNTKHAVFTAAHPSPFSAHHGFFGCKHFSKANEYLVANAQKPIQW